MLEVITETCEGIRLQGDYQCANTIRAQIMESMPSLTCGEFVPATGGSSMAYFDISLFGDYVLRIESRSEGESWPHAGFEIMHVKDNVNTRIFTLIYANDMVDSLSHLFDAQISLTIDKIGEGYVFRTKVRLSGSVSDQLYSVVYLSPFTDLFTGITRGFITRWSLQNDGSDPTSINYDDTKLISTGGTMYDATVFSPGGSTYPANNITVATPVAAKCIARNMYGYSVDSDFLYQIYRNGTLLSVPARTRVTVDGHVFWSIGNTQNLFIRLS